MWILMSKRSKLYTLNTRRLMHANHNLIKWFFRKSIFYSKKKNPQTLLPGFPESCLLPTTPSHHTPKWDPSPNLWHHGFLLPVFALYVNATMQGIFFCAQLLSLNIMFTDTSIHTVDRRNNSYCCLWLENISSQITELHYVWRPQLVYQRLGVNMLLISVIF